MKPINCLTALLGIVLVLSTVSVAAANLKFVKYFSIEETDPQSIDKHQSNHSLVNGNSDKIVEDLLRKWMAKSSPGETAKGKAKENGRKNTAGDKQESVPTEPYQGDTMDKDLQEWHTFKNEYNRNYKSTTEEQLRFALFKNRLREIEEHNELYREGFSSYWMGVNQFTDWTEEELEAVTPPLPLNRPTELGCHNWELHMPQNMSVPGQVDWRKKGYVTPVKDQKRCGSCWAFSATGTLEGQWFKRAGKLVSLSEQQLVDCAGNYGNLGCNGGLPSEALHYLRDQGGNQQESDYPYTARDGKCRFVRSKAVAKVKGCTFVAQRNEKALQEAVANVGPVSVAICVTQAFRKYRGGIFSDSQCTSYPLTHAVLVVGYGTDQGKDYWIVKNSWGKGWGASGYILMSRNQGNQCGIASNAVYPTV